MILFYILESRNLIIYKLYCTWVQFLHWVFNRKYGLIIDAFGELRSQLEQVKEDMEVCL